jgi:hypothetical protein
MHLKVFVKLKKTLKTLSSGQKNPKKPNKPKKTQKNPKNPKNPKKPKKNQKNPLGWFFFKKTRVFSNPAMRCIKLRAFCRSYGYQFCTMSKVLRVFFGVVIDCRTDMHKRTRIADLNPHQREKHIRSRIKAI